MMNDLNDPELIAALETILEFRQWLLEARALDSDWGPDYTRMIDLIDSLDRNIAMLRPRNDSIRAKLRAKWGEWHDA